MADIFIVKQRLKFSLQLVGAAAIFGALVSWYLSTQIEFAEDRNRFVFSAIITGALIIGWIGLLVFFLAAKRMLDPSQNFTDWMDSRPWWILKVGILLLLIGIGGFFLVKYSTRTKTEFELLREGNLELLAERISDDRSLLEAADPKTKQTLLREAYAENRPEAVALLLERGALAAELEVPESSPFIQSLGNLPMLEVLLSAGLNADQSDVEGNPPIHHAVANNLNDAAALLLEFGADADARDNLYRTPLLRATENDQLDFMKLLIDCGADVNTFDKRGDTALHKAVRRRNTDSLRLLLEADADPRIFNFMHMTPLHIAASGGQDELVKIMLELPDMTGLVDEDDRAPLNYALKAHKYETADLFIAAGADVNRTMKNGETLLYQVVTARDYQTARFLIRNGADAHIRNRTGESAYDLMRRKELNGLIELVDEQNPASVTNAVEAVKDALPEPAE